MKLYCRSGSYIQIWDAIVAGTGMTKRAARRFVSPRKFAVTATEQKPSRIKVSIIQSGRRERKGARSSSSCRREEADEEK